MKEAMNRSNQEDDQNQEVEIRALLTDEQRNNLESVLSERGAELEEKMYIVDMYLCPMSVLSFQDIEMHKVGSFSLRIREQTSNGKTKIEVNTKMITSEGDHNAWEEHEVAVSSFEEAVAIFQTIGFKTYFTLEKDRATYKLENMNICLEDIVDFGPVIEVEVMSSKSKSQQAKQQIRAFLGSISVSDEQIVAKSVTNMLMRERAKF